MKLSTKAIVNLLYYAGYLTMTVCYFYPMVLSVLISAKTGGRFKIPNPEVMTDWARWVIDDVESCDCQRDNILSTCVEGPVSDFEAKWPNFMQQLLDPKLVTKTRGAISRKTPESIYYVLFLGLMQSLRTTDWEVKARAHGGYTDLRLLHKQKRKAVLINVKSSNKQEDMKRDTNRALKQIVDKNYRNPEGLQNICFLREYGIVHLRSYVKGRYLELNTQKQWVEEEIRGLSQGCRTESSGKSKKRKADGTGANGSRPGARKR